MIGLVVALLALLPFQVGERLTVGETIEGEITDTDAVVVTETLTGYSSVPTVGRSFALEVEESGPYMIELRSYFFDSYLVLRDAEGVVLAEDDDGLIDVHSRVAAELLAGETYTVDACALHGRRGGFELVLRPGAPPARRLSARKRFAAAREDSERRVRTLEEALGPEHPDLAQSLNNLGVLLLRQGDFAAARPHHERALAIREKVLGPVHPDVAQSLSNLGGTLNAQGDYAGARPLVERALAIREETLDPGHPDLLLNLDNLARLVQAQGDYIVARRFQERSLAIKERILGPDHPEVAASLNGLALVLLDQGDYAGARVSFERALMIREKVLGPEHPDLAQSLDNFGALLFSKGDLAGARPLVERALTIREKAFGGEHPDVAVSLNNLAVLLGEVGDHAAARPLHERVLAIREETLGPEHPDVAASLNNLAGLLYLRGDYAGARLLNERALAIFEKVLGPEHPQVARCLASLADLLVELGDRAAARPVYERALRIQEQALGPEHPDVATSLSSLARLLVSQGDYTLARTLFERALAIREKALGPETPQVASSLSQLAMLLTDQGDVSEARRLYERTLGILENTREPEHRAIVTTLGNLASLLRSQGHDAQPLYERIVAICEKTLGPEHPQTATILNNLAVLHSHQGDHAAARPLFERALAIDEKVRGPDHPSVASGLYSLAGLLAETGDHAAARLLHERALAIREETLGPAHPDVAASLNGLALLLFDSGANEAAWQLLSRAARDSRGHVQTVLQGLSEAECYSYLSKLRWQLEITQCVGAALGDAETSIEVYERLLEWKGSIARTLVSSREQLARELDAEQAALVLDLRHAQAVLSRLLSEGPQIGPDERVSYEERVSAVRGDRNALELELKRSLQASDPEPVPTVPDLAAALPARTAVLDLFIHRAYVPAQRNEGRAVRPGEWTGARAYAWILRAGEPEVVRVDLGPSGTLGEAVRAHLRHIVAGVAVRGVGVAESEEPGEWRGALGELLWAPLAEHLKGVDTVFVSPDRYLGTLPLETIELGDGSYLVEHFAFVYQQDVASLPRPRPEPTGDMVSLLSVGAIDYGRRSSWRGAVASANVRSNDALRGSFGERWAELPATDLESRSVWGLHEEASGEPVAGLLLRAGEATEERLKHELPRHAVLHLATHGFFHPEGTPSMWDSALDERGRQEKRMGEEAGHLVGKHPGLLSGLVCAGANLPPEEGGDDGYLTAEEVGWLDLSNVELVVMSACETGLGRAESGEGLIGLRRAFRTAGAKTVVSSLWSVGDESTAELMQDFYANLWTKGMGRLEALRAAQLAMLEKNRAEHGDPLPSTWGAFVLSGEWR